MIRALLVLLVVSAVALGSLAIICLWYHQVSFAGLIAVLSSIMAWEWGRAVRGVEFDLWLLIHGLTIGVAILAAVLSFYFRSIGQPHTGLPNQVKGDIRDRNVLLQDWTMTAPFTQALS